MERPHKLILGAITLLVLVNIGFLIFGRSNINAIMNDISKSQHNIDTALIRINDTQTTLKSIKESITNFKEDVKNSRANVETLSITKTIVDTKSKAELNTLKKNMEDIKSKFEKRDTLPAINVQPL